MYQIYRYELLIIFIPMFITAQRIHTIFPEVSRNQFPAGIYIYIYYLQIIFININILLLNLYYHIVWAVSFHDSLDNFAITF